MTDKTISVMNSTDYLLTASCCNTVTHCLCAIKHGNIIVFFPLNDILASSDVNECVTTPEVCGTARCSNVIGDYECLCDEGYIYDNKTKSCLGKYCYLSLICLFAHPLSPPESTVPQTTAVLHSQAES